MKSLGRTPVGVRLERGGDRRASSGALLATALLLVMGGLPSFAAESGRTPLAPQAEFKELFTAVQSAGLFADSKVFADAVPLASPDTILQRYRAQRPQDQRALADFVAANFSLPADATAAASAALATPAASAAKAPLSLTQHIDALWPALTRQSTTVPPFSSLLPLPRPYVVPGGRFRELYYWDSYFTMLGLAQSSRQDLLADMVQDFAALIDRYGHVPNGTRTYYLSRSQPPFFFAMVGLLDKDPAAADARYLPQLRREYAFWMAGERSLAPGQARRRVVKLPDGAVLNRYWDDADTPRDESYREDAELARATVRNPRQLFRDIRAAAESGWDFSSRWFADGQNRASIITTEIVPVDLNSLLFGLENAIRAGCERDADVSCAHEFARRAAARRHAMDRYLWDARRGAYLDYRFTQRQRLPDLSAATVYPLFVGAASARQAGQVATAVQESLLQPGGLATTLRNTGQQWDQPNGWAPLQWLAVAGLRRYQQLPLAQSIACRWLANVTQRYQATGKLVEKYDVRDPERSGGGGEYPLQDGFGWTNGVTRQLAALYPACPATQGAAPGLADYVGTYQDGSQRVEIVAADSLFAVIDEAKYTLRREGADRFVAQSGDRVTFQRDAAGTVTGYASRDGIHPRVSEQVSAASAALGRPRPEGQDDPARYRYAIPPRLHDGIEVGDIERSDLGADIAHRIVRGVLDGTWKDVHSVLLYQRGHLVLEEYFYGYNRERTHQLRSATKSVVSAVVGEAVDRHALSGVDERVLPLLGYATLANPDWRKSQITLGDLLTMSSGLECDDHNAQSQGNELVIDEQPDWVKATLDLPLTSDPGTTAHYCSGGVAVVGRATENAVHARLPDYAQQTLFGPLGIKRRDWQWNYTLTNANKEYSQIHLRPRDMLKLGLLYSNGGRWHGRQVLSEAWVKASLAPQSRLEDTDYGYFWWRPWLNVSTPQGEQHVTINAAQGNGGQKIYLVPQYQLVAVFTAGDYNSGGSPPNRIMAQVILPRLIAKYDQGKK
ncbi:MAG TPA: alpha,alpha-trehalase TreF [Steroidobacteraceae bacterium]|nr:alpha,alpha-trehalase TreF [Steroidobacteraceae bacterium]